MIGSYASNVNAGSGPAGNNRCPLNDILYVLQRDCLCGASLMPYGKVNSVYHRFCR